MQITYVDNLHSRVGGTRKGYRVVNVYVNARKIGCLFYISTKVISMYKVHAFLYVDNSSLKSCQSIFQFTNIFDFLVFMAKGRN